MLQPYSYDPSENQFWVLVCTANLETVPKTMECCHVFERTMLDRRQIRQSVPFQRNLSSSPTVRTGENLGIKANNEIHIWPYITIDASAEESYTGTLNRSTRHQYQCELIVIDV